MEQRLVSETMMQLTDQINPYFAAYAQFVAYQIQFGIKIKTLNKQVREANVEISERLTTYFFSAHREIIYLNVLMHDGCLNIYEVSQNLNEIKAKFYDKIECVKNPVSQEGELIYMANQIVKVYSYSTKQSENVCSCSANALILKHEGQNIMTKTDNVIQIYVKTAVGYEKDDNCIDYILNPIAVHRDRYVFEAVKNSKQIYIYDLVLSKQVGKFEYIGEIIYAALKQNVLLIVANYGNIDKYYLYALNPNTSNSSIINNRCVYEKSRSDCIEVFNVSLEWKSFILSGGKGENPRMDSMPAEGRALLIYVLPKSKHKVQIITVSHSKIKQNQFREEEVDKLVHSKVRSKQEPISLKNNKKENEALEIEKIRVAASMSYKKHQKEKVSQIQKKMIEQIIDVKIKGVIQKFGDLEKRLARLQGQISSIYNKIQRSIENINREEVKQQVQILFDKVTPQFETYFGEVFRQISGVLDQGVSYFTAKLARESDIHRDALAHLMNMTFDATEQIVALGMKELKYSQKMQESIEKLLEIRKKWNAETQSSTSSKEPTSTLATDYQLTLQETNTYKKHSPDKVKK